MKTSIIIHGHFYQPPRENPYTGVLPVQASAKPYENWNEAIYQTCYKPNSASRYLSFDGKIDHIYNNYASISTNMGQTLLDWIDQEHPAFMKKLAAADRDSIRVFGHSTLMAQGFNHTIMPLDCEHTKRIQTHWAIESYKRRFGHAPEGFWLAECAINEETVDILAEYGIKFVVLAPWQAIAIDGVALNGKPMPSDRPFIIKGRNGGSLSAFFYNGEFASGVSFGHMLRDADAMFKRLKELRREMGNPALISWATDGEIYGHHEPFGDMGLAALVRKINESSEFRIDNFASYLERHPATEVATLGGGDDGKGTSWSCMHGVGRWERDCGCHTGGDDSWNQKWRKPLRKAFNNLENSGRKVIDAKVREILGNDADYRTLTLAYADVVSHSKTVRQFMDEARKTDGSSLSENEKVVIATLLEAFKNIMFSYTSCGWFFNDLAGIEPRQNISYGVYAAGLLDQYSDRGIQDRLFSDLSKAKGNLAENGTGEDIARKDIPSRPAFIKACSYFAMNRLVADPSDYVEDWGFMHLESYSDSEMTIVNTRTLQRHEVAYKLVPYSNRTMGFHVEEGSTGIKATTNVIRCSDKSRNTFIAWTENRLSAGFPEAMIDTLAENIGNYLILVATNRSLFKETIFTENIGSCIKAIKAMILALPDMDEEKKIQRIRQLLTFVGIKGRQIDIDDITDAFSSYLRKAAISLIIKLDEKTVRMALRMLETARADGFKPDITDLQNAVYPYLELSDDPKESDIPDELKRQLAADLNFKPVL
ncbi:MAG: DUF3536 domain-containing protein [Spirochaetales bacterium]|nr:DUF3536 domain-containing protein [Spirochaetales bacterium]